MRKAQHNEIEKMNKNTLSDAEVSELQQQLWQKNEQGKTPTVYAILGGARDKQIERIIRQGELKSSCLIDGKLTYQMSIAAPYIVRLEFNHPQTIEILKKGWGNNWGIFAITYSPATLINVRQNCRKIAMVKSPEGKNLYFRYYDPRVLRIYLSACDTSEANKVFGPITDFILEGQDNGVIHRYRRTEQGVVDVNINLLNITAIKNQTVKPGLLEISKQQISAFKAVRFKRFITEMELHLSTYFAPQTTSLIEQELLNSWVNTNVKHAQDFGFITELDICRYLNVAIIQGESVKDAPWLQAIMAESLFPSTKATLIEEKSLELLDQEHQAVVKELDKVNLLHLERFYQKHHKKVLGVGVPLFDLRFEDDKALKSWMFRVGKQCINVGLTDEMALDIWLDIAMRYGENFPKENWAILSETQKEALSPSAILFHLSAQQPHKQSA
ncbi:DUF4123 domain-containing protein [Psychromonas sp. Urea-02u-13]|uniref:DUF4123 domain-containing protein n=1 Tax=Psychromonas sp. Urea-02u-13 TaxID=2058326 RepID=UPI0012FF3377|nr:DUF4123 domain-containing protein [Psychromonas sp. Urea-02u-13]